MTEPLRARVVYFHKEIIGRLTPITDADLNEFAGMSSVMTLYDSTSGQDRTDIKEGFRSVLRRGLNPVVLSRAVAIVTSLDIVEAHPDLVRLRKRRQSQNEPLKTALDKYFATRRLKEL